MKAHDHEIVIFDALDALAADSDVSVGEYQRIITDVVSRCNDSFRGTLPEFGDQR